MTRAVKGPWGCEPGPGFRTCYRKRAFAHHPDFLLCNCLRTEIPAKARAKSSGALGTPDRNHDCPECERNGFTQESYVAPGGYRICITLNRCARCGGSGELTASGAPGVRS